MSQRNLQKLNERNNITCSIKKTPVLDHNAKNGGKPSALASHLYNWDSPYSIKPRNEFSTLDSIGAIPAPPVNLKYVKKSSVGSVKSLAASSRQCNSVMSRAKQKKESISSKLSTTSRCSSIGSKYENQSEIGTKTLMSIRSGVTNQKQMCQYMQGKCQKRFYRRCLCKEHFCDFVR